MGRVRLKAPLGELFDDALPEQQVRRLWNRLQPRFQLHPRREFIKTVSLVVPLCVAALLLLQFLSRSPEPLHSAGGGNVPPGVLAHAPRPIELDDGSRIEVGGDARLEVLENTGRAFVLALRRGRARFEVEPGGPRAWRVESGPVSIEVVGTRFVVERDQKSVRVGVERGKVLVSGTGVPDRVTRLGPGDSLRIRTSEPATGAQPAPSPVDSPGTTASPHRRSRVFPHSEASAKPNAREEDPAETETAEAHAALEDAGPSVDDLLAQADEARREGRHRRAAELLHLIIAEYDGDARAALAEFSLGRLYLDSLGQAQRAATHFERSIKRGLPAALREDAHARLVQAHARTGNWAGAQRAATAYRSLYPRGQYTSDVSRWVPETGR